jgi:hypothetical protein
MSAFLKLNKQDAYITPYTAFKSYAIASESFSDNGIEVYYGENSPDFTVLYSLEPTGEQAYINGYHKHLVYRSIDQLYFSNYSGSEASGSYENFKQTTLYEVTRSLGDKVSILSIPKERYGSSIRPGTFVLYYDGDQAVIDNKEGQLIDYSSSLYLGEIIYPHGIAIITNPNYTDILYKTQTTQSFSRKVRTDQIEVSSGQFTAFSSSQDVTLHPITASVDYYFPQVFFDALNFKFTGDALTELYFNHSYFENNNAPSFTTGPWSASAAPSQYWTGSLDYLQGGGPFIVDPTNNEDIIAFENYLQTLNPGITSVDTLTQVHYTFTIYSVDSTPISPVGVIQITSSLDNNFLDEASPGGLTGSDFFNNTSSPGTFGMITSSNMTSEFIIGERYSVDITASISYTATSQSFTPQYFATSSITLFGGQTWSSEIINYINAYNANLAVKVFQDTTFIGNISLLSSSLSLGGNTGILSTGVIGPYTSSNPGEYEASYFVQGDGFNIDLASGEPAWPPSSQIVNTPVEIVGQGNSTVAAIVDANTILLNTYVTPFPLNTTGSLLGNLLTGSTAGRYTSLAFDNQYDIFTQYYHCKVSQNQLNFSQNPTSYTNLPVSGTINNNITGSYFQPYVTTIGLYNDMNELIAVGKLGQPIPKSQYTDTTFVVRLDM